jgi:RNA polymerase sigma-70 factor (ECF subfamily)
VLAGTLRLARDLDIAEEATADAFLLALQTWPERGVPDSVEAWLLTAARRRAIDKIRRADVLRSRLGELARTGRTTADAADHRIERPAVLDDELRLVVLCCHPALSAEAQVALTLRLGCGVPTAAIAAAFLVSEPTMAARLTRAKRRIAASGVSVDLPDDDTVDARMPAVRGAVHLAYTTGHTASAGSALRNDDLAARALRLAGTLAELRPYDREVAGLHALVLFTEARHAGRFGADGEQILLDAADRSRWDAELVNRGLRALAVAVGGGGSGPYALQAAIAAEHASAPTFSDTDWTRIVALYDQLLAVHPSPTIALGRCAAMSYLRGPQAGLADLDEVLALGSLDRYPYAHALRAQLLDRLDARPEARREWIRAASCARTDAERDYFAGRAGS